jgi:ribonuclease J
VNTFAQSTNAVRSSIEVIAVGGYSVFGRNCTVYRGRDTSIAIDAGIRFGASPQGGTSIQAMTGLDNLLTTKVSAIVLTHAHEDHIGSLPYMNIKDLPEIYAAPFTAAVVQKKFELNSQRAPAIKIVDPNSPLKIGDALIHFVPMSHSIPEAYALLIEMCGWRIFHTGDYKFDFGPGEHFFSQIDLLKHCADSEVDILVSDSTNATNPGFCPSEEVVSKSILSHLARQKRRSFIASFSSHVHRLANLAIGAERLGYRSSLASNSIMTYLEAATNTGQFSDLGLANHLMNSLNQPASDGQDQVIFISGTQGEKGSGLERLASGQHQRFELTAADRVIISARTIPGNEASVQALVQKLRSTGCELITPREDPAVHVSGHACGGDLKLLAGMLKPKYLVPMHGDRRMQEAAISALKELHLPSAAAFLIREGSGLLFSDEQVIPFEAEESPVTMLDEASRNMISADDLADRSRSFAAGSIFGTAVFDPNSSTWTVPFSIEMLGIAAKDSDQILAVEKSVHERIDYELFKNRVVDPVFLSRIAEDQLGRSFLKSFRSKPVIRCRVYFAELL